MRMKMPFKIALLLALCLPATVSRAEPYPSTYQPLVSEPTLIRNATILTGTGARMDGADLFMSGGKIEFAGAGEVPQGVNVIDVQGRWVTPGLIDVHSHLGVYPSPRTWAHTDGNEMIDPATPNVWAEHSIWPQDPGFSRALVYDRDDPARQPLSDFELGQLQGVSR